MCAILLLLLFDCLSKSWYIYKINQNCLYNSAVLTELLYLTKKSNVCQPGFFLMNISFREVGVFHSWIRDRNLLTSISLTCTWDLLSRLSNAILIVIEWWLIILHIHFQLKFKFPSGFVKEQVFIMKLSCWTTRKNSCWLKMFMKFESYMC